MVKWFDDYIVVFGVIFLVEKGEVFGFLGFNGVGKFMMMKMIMGFLLLMEGKIVVCGYDVCEDLLDV